MCFFFCSIRKNIEKLRQALGRMLLSKCDLLSSKDFLEIPLIFIGIDDEPVSFLDCCCASAAVENNKSSKNICGTLKIALTIFNKEIATLGKKRRTSKNLVLNFSKEFKNTTSKFSNPATAPPPHITS